LADLGPCADGQTPKWDDAGGEWVCADDEDTTYGTGAGLQLNDHEFSAAFGGTGAADTVARSDHDHDEAYVNDEGGEVGDADVPSGALSPDRISGTAWTGANDGSGSGLDADLLDGQHGSFYRSASNLNAGTLATDRYSAYNDLTSEGRLDDNAGSDLLTRAQADGRYWSLSGNAGTSPGTDFLGTTDNQALELHVNNARALRIEPNEISPNLIGGHSSNAVVGGVRGATIGGGGYWGGENQVTGSYGTVGGGFDNTSGLGGTVGGGGVNTVSGLYSTVGGGYVNKADGGNYATIGGGIYNIARGEHATIPGGYDNEAAGDYSFAAGRHAKALHEGSFVWADSGDPDYSSSNSDQFSVRASNGMFVLSNNWLYGLQVDHDDASSNGDGIRAYANVSKGNIWGAVYAVNAGSSPGVYASTSGTYAGYFKGSIYVNGSCVGCSLAYLGINDGGVTLETGDLVAVSGVGDPLAGTGTPVLRVRRAGPGSAAAIIGVVQSGAVVVGSAKDHQYLESAERAEGSAAPNDHVFLITYGLAQVKVDAPLGSIATGQRLTAGDRPGHARPLETRTLDGMVVSEGAQVLGIALAPPDTTSGLIPVFVTLQ
jgi:hypothetical protein